MNGTIIYNLNDEFLKKHIPPRANSISYIGKLDIIQSYPFLELDWNGLKISSGLVGHYNEVNVRAAISLALLLEMNKEDIIDGLKKYQSTNNRSEIRNTERNTLILDAYNANPTSMRASISSFHESRFDNKILILGHMLEVGDGSQLEHQALFDFCLQYNWKFIYLIGYEFNNVVIEEFSNVSYYATVNELILSIGNKDYMFNGETIFIKGSRGAHLEKFDSLFIRFLGVFRVIHFLQILRIPVERMNGTYYLRKGF